MYHSESNFCRKFVEFGEGLRYMVSYNKNKFRLLVLSNARIITNNNNKKEEIKKYIIL